MTPKPTSNSKLLPAIIACLIFYLLYTTYLNKRYPDYNRPQTAPTTSETATTLPATPATTPATGASTLTGGSDVKTLPGDQLTYSNDVLELTFDQTIGGLSSAKLKGYKTDLVADASLVNVLDNPLTIQGIINSAQVTSAGMSRAERNGNTLRFSRMSGVWTITEEWRLPDAGYGIDLVVSYTNSSASPADLTAGVLMEETFTSHLVKGGTFLPGFPQSRPSAAVHVVNGSVTRAFPDKFCSEVSNEAAESLRNEPIDYFGFDKHYFLVALMPSGAKYNVEIRQSGIPTEERCPLALVASQAYGMVQPGQIHSQQFRVFIGPKATEVLANTSATLGTSLDFGWFDMIARPMLAGIKWLHGVTGNWGVAIILMTILLKILFYPLTKASVISGQRMKKLSPEMQRLKEKFKGDPRQQQMELMKFMSAHKINPMKGCLPILPQIPVFFAYYRVLSASIELRQAPFAFWIHDLSAHDPYYVTPLLLGVLMFVQQKLTPNPGMDKTQERILLIMPVVFSFMMLTLPSGMVLYMVTNSVMTILQQQWLTRRLK